MSSVNWGDMNKVEYFGKMGGMMISMRTFLFPLQVVKTRLQFQNKADRQYRGIIDAVRKIGKSEGYRGFFKGYPISLMSLPAGIIYLMTLELGWQYLPTNMPPVARDSLSGVCACAASQLWMVPIDVVSQHQQVNTHDRFSARDQLRQTRELQRSIYAREGLAGFYRGFWISLCTFGPQSAIFWTLFFATKKKLFRLKNENLQVCIAAGSSSVFTNLVTTPLDTVRARYQLNKEPTTTKETFLRLWHAEKIPGLYKGYFARTLYGLVNSSPILMGYFWIRQSSQRNGSDSWRLKQMNVDCIYIVIVIMKV